MRCAMSANIRIMKRIARPEMVTSKGNSLQGFKYQHVLGNEVATDEGSVGMAVTDHGVPRFICCCTTMKFANIPRVVPADASMMRSQKLSWASGQ